ncbi:MAG: class I SAM-dependent methyltransferase [Polyangia bacterium]|jgi:ubiquinone/menaquinone biosynthesis C-methylase UbiE
MAEPSSTQSYYDKFSSSYERERQRGYHRMIDELELELVRRYGTGRDVLEAGCGTGLLLVQARQVARSALGLDLSRGMLVHARARGLRIVQGSLLSLPLPDNAVDLVYSMKVLAHVPAIRPALAELARVTRPGGHLLLEFYNPRSLRYLGKLLGGAAAIAEGTTDRDVYTRYDRPSTAKSYLPACLEYLGMRGVRVLTPSSQALRVPVLAGLLARAEHLACDLPVLRNFGGFQIVIARKRMS